MLTSQRRAERFPPSWNAHHACKNDPGRRGHQYRADLIEKFETLDPETQFQAADLIFRHGWTWQRAFQTAYDQYKRSLEERRMERMERLEEDRAASAAARESRRRRRQLLRDVQGQLPNERQAQDDAAEATGAAEATEAAQNDEEEGREDLAVLEVPATTAAPQSDTAANSAPHPDDFEDLDSEEEEDMDLQRALAASMETHAAAQFSMTILPAAMETTTTTTRPAQAADGAN